MANIISNRLRNDAEKIMKLWEIRAHEEIYKEFRKDSLVLRNSLPEYLTQLMDALSDVIERTPKRVSDDKDDSSRVGKKHGHERAISAVDSIGQLIFEYHILRQVIFQVLEEKEELPKHARDTIIDSVEQAVNDAATQFNETTDKIRVDEGEKVLQGKERELQESELRFQRLVLSVNDYAIFMLDPKGNIVTWNEGARRLKGYEESEIIGKHFSIFYPKEEIANGKPERELKEAVALGRYEEEGWRLRKDGSRFWANVVIGQVRDEYGNLIGFSKVTRDLTERKRTQDKLNQAYEGLAKRVEERTAELNEALLSRDEFLSIASHELKTPLTSLSLNLQMLGLSINKLSTMGELEVRIGQQSLEKMYRSVESCEKQSKRLASMLDELLDLTRIRAGKLELQRERLDICHVVQEIVGRHKPDLERAKITLSLRPCDPIIAELDRMRFEQVLTNLISNAIKYGQGKPIEISVGLDSGNAQVVVKDQGLGISSDKQKKIFEKFERVTAGQSIAGLGLGLYIVSQIVNAHGGTIGVQSNLGEGSTFIVNLPLTESTKR